ncbi:MAG TPA: DUF4337 family protein, partial [Arenibacter sp.]|nr:DUF4337 family protein [Arenibacter sp.]
MQDDTPTKTTNKTRNSREAIASILLVLFAFLMAVAELVNNNLEEQMMISHNQHVNYSNWYQAKSIKQNLKESELEYLNALMESGVVPDNKIQNLKNRIAHTKTLALKYEAEKTELLVGSSN